MAVLVEGISVVVKRKAIDQKFDSGWTGFVEAVPNATLCADDELARVGFLDPAAVEKYLATLERAGLQVINGDRFVDGAVVDQQRGPTLACDWLEFAKISFGDRGKVSACWIFEGPRVGAGLHLRSPSMSLATPPGWTYEGSLSEKFLFVPMNRSDACQTIRLSATGGGPGGGWNYKVEFRSTPAGHAVWNEIDDGSERVTHEVLASEKPLTWRSAAEDLLELRGPSFSLRSESLRDRARFDGVPAWVGNLLLLLWIEDEDGLYFDRKFGEFFLKFPDDDLDRLLSNPYEIYTSEYVSRIERLMMAAELLCDVRPTLPKIAGLLELPPEASLDQIHGRIQEGGGSLGLANWLDMRSEGELIEVDVLNEARELPSPTTADLVVRVLHSWCAALKNCPELAANTLPFLSWALAGDVPSAGEQFARAYPSEFETLRSILTTQQPAIYLGQGSVTDRRNAELRYAMWNRVAAQLRPQGTER